MKYYRGRFVPHNPSKYNGNPTNIIYRSSWEFRVMRYLDENSSIVQWSSEELAIPYVSPLDGRVHRYFPDFIVKIERDSNPTTIHMIEIKPAAQTKIPTVRKTSQPVTRKYITEVMTYGVNNAKWQAATEYCNDRGWKFIVITERELFGKK